jgi:LysR family transcriptional regulator, transcriptional activator of the cysJI operon
MQLDARLRAFAAVARQGSFSLAAAELYISQPAISKHVASLEAELSARLVDRRRSGAVLTPTGRVLADYVLRAEALLANAARAVAAAQDPAAGTVNVVASGIPGDYLLPKLLPAFRERYPLTNVQLRVTTSGDALARVRAHEAELAVVGGLDGPPELDFESLIEDELVLVGPPSLGGRRLRPADLARTTWITREEGSSTRAAVESARWQLGIHGVETLELGSWEGVKTTVAAGGGVAAISRFAIEHELASGALVVLDVARWQVQRTISIVTARDVPLTAAASRFRDALRELSVSSAAGSAVDVHDALARLGVFVGGFEADAAEYVCDVSAATLEGLVEAGSVVRDGRRFNVATRTRRKIPAGVARRHAEFFASLVEESEPHLTHQGHGEWTDRLENEWENVNAAVRWAGVHADRALQLRILGHSWHFWLARGYPKEWERALEDALADVADPRLRLLALPTLGWLAWDRRQLERALSYGEERLRVAREVGDAMNEAGALELLAGVAETRRDVDAARRLHQQAIEVNRKAGEDVGLMRHLHNFSIFLVNAGELDAAEKVLRESTAIAQARGDEAHVDDTMEVLALVAQLRGRARRALDLVGVSAQLHPLVPDAYHWGLFEVAGASAIALGLAAPGAQLLAAAERWRAAAEHERTPPITSIREPALETARRELGAAEFARETRRGSKLSVEDALELVRELSRARSAARRSSARGASRSASSRARRARR